MDIAYSYFLLLSCITYKEGDRGGFLPVRKQHFHFNFSSLVWSWWKAFQMWCIRILQDRKSHRTRRFSHRIERLSDRTWRSSHRTRRFSHRTRRFSHRTRRFLDRIWRLSVRIWRMSHRVERLSDRTWRFTHQIWRFLHQKYVKWLFKCSLRFGGAIGREIPAKMSAFTF